MPPLDEHLPTAEHHSGALGGANLDDAMTMLAQACDVNLVMPSDAVPPLTLDLEGAVSCDDVLRPGRRRRTWCTWEASRSRASAGSRSPVSTTRCRSRTRFRPQHLEAARAANITIDVRDTIDNAHVTLELEDVPWSYALDAVLSEDGLRFRYDDHRVLHVEQR